MGQRAASIANPATNHLQAGRSDRFRGCAGLAKADQLAGELRNDRQHSLRSKKLRRDQLDGCDHRRVMQRVPLTNRAGVVVMIGSQRLIARFVLDGSSMSVMAAGRMRASRFHCCGPTMIVMPARHNVPGISASPQGSNPCDQQHDQKWSVCEAHCLSIYSSVRPVALRIMRGVGQLYKGKSPLNPTTWTQNISLLRYEPPVCSVE